MDGQAHSHEDMEYLMRLAPYVESPRPAFLGNAGLEGVVPIVSYALLNCVSRNPR